MKNGVQVFKGSINDIQDMINSWATQNRATILSTSLCYDTNAAVIGHVFVIVVYTVE
ncbi:hypothetical protein CCAX7_28170 [Capsulimonas corticalis]|uniref:Uncharacterized protein n=1 Tax=Capsulimonas corticalis TaxID=2219043 RepID=A0A402CTC3_9BACT|nr:hypothetical protein [Capsulimonas corticalis]BDI30766.1 hypothetical protein CCAX7_28170 [Capsulimonas corticalis]